MGLFFAIISIVGLLAVLWYARARIMEWMQGGEEIHGGGGFTLSDLRAMHKRGQMSDEEFARAKAQLVAGVHAKRAAEVDAAGVTDPPGLPRRTAPPEKSDNI